MSDVYTCVWLCVVCVCDMCVDFGGGMCGMVCVGECVRGVCRVVCCV